MKKVLKSLKIKKKVFQKINILLFAFNLTKHDLKLMLKNIWLIICEENNIIYFFSLSDIKHMLPNYINNFINSIIVYEANFFIVLFGKC